MTARLCDAQSATGSIGPYRLRARLGDGGMGTVFLAERRGDGFVQRVAVKILRSDLASPHLAARLVREREILARLEHPGIARFIDGGTTPEGRPYVAMEYVPGQDLLTHANTLGLPVTERVRLMVEVAEAVHYAHSELVVHRDLKPSNIMVTPDGRPRLLDFGIAKLLEPGRGAADAGQTGSFLTPEYASPEQLLGEPIRTLTDCYSLGVVLYELLTGRLPHPIAGASLADIGRQVCESAPPPPSATAAAAGHRGLARELAGDLDAIVLKALERDPNRRHPSAAELAADLRRYLTGEPVSARPPGLFGRLGQLFRRPRLASFATG